MFLFIFESIGTSELILIAVVALIVFGPRKLPQMAKTIGKTMADFRNATNEFKSTWQKEVALEEEEKNAFTLPDIENQISGSEKTTNENIVQPENENLPSKPTIKELTAGEIAERFHGEGKIKESAVTEKKETETINSGKRDWL